MRHPIEIATRAAVLVAAMLPGCAPARAIETERPAPTPVKVHALVETTDAVVSRYAGSLEPLSRVDMAFRVSGYVASLGIARGDGAAPRPLDDGDAVTKGMVLARVRPHDYLQKLTTARAQIAQARSEAKLAELELARAEKLFETRSITKAELDAKEAHAESAKAGHTAAKASVAEAQIGLEDTVLRAPLAGVVLARHVEVGSLVAPGQLAVSIVDTSALKAVFAVPQAVVERLHVGSPLHVYVSSDGAPAGLERRIEAAVTHIAPVADGLGRVFAVESVLPNASGALRPGSVVSVHVPAAFATRGALTVPLASVVRSPRDARGFAVFVLEGQGARGKVRLCDVALGEVLGNAVTVRAGLTTGQRVVTVGSTLLRDGGDAVVIR